jgi:hypothetical protein
MAELEQISVATHRFIRKNGAKLVDNVFQRGATGKYLRDTLKEDYTGGRLIQENVLYDVTSGGFYQKGESFDITQHQMFEHLEFLPKYFYENITLFKEDIQVLNRAGSEAEIFSLVKAATETAFRSAGAKINLAVFFQGQGVGTSNYIKGINGFAEALNDGSAPSWDGNSYTTYGGLTRGGKVGTTLNSIPVKVDGTLELPLLEEQYGKAMIDDEPNLIITTPLNLSYLKEKLWAQQIYETTQDVKAGITALKFNGANILWDRYCPGSEIAGRVDPAANRLLDQTIGLGTSYPTMTSTAGAAGESLWILTAKKPFINFYVSSDEEYAFGFTGFKVAQDNTVIAGQILLAANMTVPAPRVHRQLHTITG